MAVNVSYHRALRTSPYVFKYGKEPIFEIDKKHNIQAKNYSLLELEHAKKQNWEDYAKNNIEKGKIECKLKFKVGDRCLIYKELLGNKMSTGWQNGYTVVEILENDSYVVSDGKIKLRLNKIHMTKEYISREACLRYTSYIFLL
ncbi:hypothetical protein BDAP_001585 [Binucleata daphniae]